MTNALFTFRRRVTTGKDGAPLAEAQHNENYINVTQVTSAYWQAGDNGQVLSVFLANGFNLTFNESTGNKFLTHWEDFLRLTLATATVSPVYTQSAQSHSRNSEKARRAPTAIDVIEEATDNGAVWDQPQA